MIQYSSLYLEKFWWGNIGITVSVGLSTFLVSAIPPEWMNQY